MSKKTNETCTSNTCREKLNSCISFFSRSVPNTDIHVSTSYPFCKYSHSRSVDKSGSAILCTDFSYNMLTSAR